MIRILAILSALCITSALVIVLATNSVVLWQFVLLNIFH